MRNRMLLVYGIVLGTCAFVPACGGGDDVLEGPVEGESETDSSALAQCKALPAKGVSASGNDGNVPANVLDGNLSTRWSSLGVGQLITLDLGASSSLCGLSIAWYQGDQRRSTFTASVSDDGTTFRAVLATRSRGRTTAAETYALADTKARYVRVTVNGNTLNDWASITELRALGAAPTNDAGAGDGSPDSSDGGASDAGNTDGGPLPPPTKCDIQATPSNFAAQFTAAQAGNVICLANGSYGTFRGAQKSGTVTIRSASGRGATIEPDFTTASNVRLDSVTINGGRVGGSSKSITISSSTFTSVFLVDTQSANANIVFDGNTHSNIDAPSGSYPARLTVYCSGSPSGITIQNSLFGPGGDADGVRPDCDDVQVLKNEFSDLVDKGGNHADPIQFYGARRAVIRGNYFHNQNGEISAYIMQADGGEGNVIEDNVFAGGRGLTYGITLYSDKGSIIRHNTFQRGVGGFNVPSGTLNLGNKPGQPVSTGTIIRDNILASASGGPFSGDHNLTQSAVDGPLNVVGAPVFVGPLTSYAGFRLAAGSPGKGAASDGLDVGIR